MLHLKDDTGSRRPRDEKGRIVTRACPDPNCDGELVYEIERGFGLWICNGLTHDGEQGELEACGHHHFDGEKPVS